MSNQGMVLAYVLACLSGAFGMADCGPVWQLGVIAALLLACSVTLGILQLRRVYVAKARSA